MFATLQKKRQAEQAAIKPQRRGFRRVRNSDRSQTQPVTPEELSEASHIAKQMAEKAKSTSQEKLEKMEKLQEIVEEEKEDELSKMSLSEKMKLFHQKAETKVEPRLPKVEPPRRRRRNESRYKTQPVTIEEVKKAAKFSPLARSFAAPPDPQILSTMPIADQIALVYGDNGLDDTPAMPLLKKTLTRHDSEPNIEDKKSILKQSSFEKTTTVMSSSILKTEIIEEKHLEAHSIMKDKVATNVGIKSDRMRGILKEYKQSSTESDDTQGILRRDASPDSLSKEPGSILKKETIMERHSRTHGILKDSGDERITPKGSPKKRGILRKEDSTEADVDSGADDTTRRRKISPALSSSDRPRPRREKVCAIVVTLCLS